MNSTHDINKQNRTEQNRTEQNRTEQNRTEEKRREQKRTEKKRREENIPATSVLFVDVDGVALPELEQLDLLIFNL